MIISFILALRSLKELKPPSEMAHLVKKKKTGGVIIFMKEKIVHYKS